MTEAEFLEESAKDFETMASDLDAHLAKATEASWKAICPDNGWTSAQILEHMCLAATRYENDISEKLAKADPSDGSQPVKLAFFTKLLLHGFYKRKLPVPRSLEVTEPINKDTSLAHWETCKELMRTLFEAARGKRLSQPRFANPVVPVLKMSVADFFAVQIEHMCYHAGQIQSRVGV